MPPGSVNRSYAQVQGSHYERHLFEDTDKLASLILKPVGQGNYHVTGMVNHTHRIEPCENWERSTQERLAHRISLIDVTPGSYDVVNDVENEYGNDPRYPEIESRDLPDNYTVSLRLQQLEPPARIGLTAIEGLQVKQDYLHLHDDGRVMVDQTLDALGDLARTSKVHKMSDILYMAV
ncbi:hypothetical protein MTO96_046288, partial [Rhipicephalus appendiculatus]